MCSRCSLDDGDDAAVYTLSHQGTRCYFHDTSLFGLAVALPRYLRVSPVTCCEPAVPPAKMTLRKPERFTLERYRASCPVIAVCMQSRVQCSSDKLRTYVTSYRQTFLHQAVQYMTSVSVHAPLCSLVSLQLLKPVGPRCARVPPSRVPRRREKEKASTQPSASAPLRASGKAWP